MDKEQDDKEKQQTAINKGAGKMMKSRDAQNERSWSQEKGA